MKVVVASLSSEASERAVEALVAALRDAGMEVVLAGKALGVPNIVPTVVQEDAAAVVLADSERPSSAELGELVDGLRRQCGEGIKVVLPAETPNKAVEILLSEERGKDRPCL